MIHRRFKAEENGEDLLVQLPGLTRKCGALRRWTRNIVILDVQSAQEEEEDNMNSLELDSNFVTLLSFPSFPLLNNNNNSWFYYFNVKFNESECF